MKTNRIEALSDALFAIVLTLLILEIRIPQLSNPVSVTELRNSLIMLSPKFISFAVSFVVVSVFWIGHHNQFNFINKSDRIFLWLNILLFMFVSFIPFSSGLLGEYPKNQLSIVFYGVNLIIVGFILYMHWNYAVKNKLTPNLSKEFINGVNKRILIGPLFYFIGIMASFLNPFLSLICFIVPVVIQILPGNIDRFLKKYN